MSRSVALVRIKKLSEDAKLPFQATPGSAGMDICSIEDTVELLPGTVAVVATGLAMSIPKGYEGQVRSRSGLAAKNGVFVLNSPGTIDGDYRGEIKVILANFGKETVTFKKGDRIAQLIIASVPEVLVVSIEKDLSETSRGSGGFGSTGIK